MKSNICDTGFLVGHSKVRNHPASASTIACNIDSALNCKFSIGAPSRFKVLIKLKFVVKPNMPLVSLVAPAFFINAALIKCMTLKVSDSEIPKLIVLIFFDILFF